MSSKNNCGSANEVTGFLKFNNQIVEVKSYKDFKKICLKIEHDFVELPREAKRIYSLNEKNRKSIEEKNPNKKLDFSKIDLYREESYDAEKFNCFGFKKHDEYKDGIQLDLGNQCSGYEFDFLGKTMNTVESLYLCGEFSNNTPEHKLIQEKLILEKNGLYCKRIKIQYKDQMRSDWDAKLKAQWMLFSIWNKCRNPKFRDKLLSIPADAYIIENSTTVYEDTAVEWGCMNPELEQARKTIREYAESLGMKKDAVTAEANKIHNIGKFSGGMNLTGKIMKLCQLALLNGTTPPIDFDLLRSSEIYFLGNKLTFEDYK